MPSPQRFIVLEHPPPQRRHRLRRFDFYVHQHDPVVGGRRPGQRNRLSNRQPGDQIQIATLALRRIGEDLLVQPFQAGEVESVRPLREKQLQEFRKELAQQDLQPLVVIAHVSRSSPAFTPAACLSVSWQKPARPRAPQRAGTPGSLPGHWLAADITDMVCLHPVLRPCKGDEVLR